MRYLRPIRPWTSGAIWPRYSREPRERLRLLELAGDLVPSVEWFVYAFVRKEAVLSAQIEGTQATLMDLLEVEASGEAPVDADVEEVCGYVDALNYAWEELESESGLPLSMRLLCETHRRLLAGARGAQKLPGEVRRSQNWVGGTRPGNANFVPPPPHRLGELLSDFERAIHDESDLPPLVRVGLLHAQFETLHPYLDGNGRLGRLLITLLLRHWGLLSRPLLYLSLFLKTHRQEYYRRLEAIRTDGDWEGWLAYFLEGVAVVADEAVATARRIHAIVEENRETATRPRRRHGAEPSPLRTATATSDPDGQSRGGAARLLQARGRQGTSRARGRGGSRRARRAKKESGAGIQGLSRSPSRGHGADAVRAWGN